MTAESLNKLGLTLSREQTRSLLDPDSLELFDAGINAWLEERVFHGCTGGVIVDQLGNPPPSDGELSRMFY